MMMMIDSFQPEGVTELAVDSIFMMPHLGVLSQVNEQAAVEATFSIVTAGLSGANLIHDVGFLASAMIGSHEMVVLSDEVVGMAKRFLSGIEINDDTLALGVLRPVGGVNHLSRMIVSHRAMGVRGHGIGGKDFLGWPVDADHLVGVAIHAQFPGTVELDTGSGHAGLGDQEAVIGDAEA